MSHHHRPVELVVSTRNAGKLRELRALLSEVAASTGVPIALSTAAERGVPDVEETGDTFEANALLKAAAAFELTGAPCLADDSGLAVDALDGAPGVYSARFSGPGATSATNNSLLVQRLSAVPDHERGASFVCHLVLLLPEAVSLPRDPEIPWRVVDRALLPAGAVGVSIQGRVGGRILTEARGEGGFGYDPLFFHDPSGKTFAELTSAEKNRISHRGRALDGLRDCLTRSLGQLGAAPS